MGPFLVALLTLSLVVFSKGAPQKTSKERDKNAEDEDSKFPDFFKEVEKELNIEIPLYIKNLLIANGYDNEVLLEDFSEQDVYTLELYGRTILHHNIPKSDYKDYVGTKYCDNPLRFRITPEDKQLLLQIQNYFDKKDTSNRGCNDDSCVRCRPKNKRKKKGTAAPDVTTTQEIPSQEADLISEN